MQDYPTNYQYLYAKPTCSGVIRSCNEDFQVTEIPAFEHDGEGEHWYFKIQKNGENSDWVAKQLALFFDVSSKEIGYAGKKDRHAITQQWFSVCLPGVMEINIDKFNTDTIKVLDIRKHSRKLRTGALKGNRFAIVVKNVSDDLYFAQRLSLIEQGVPNYFGEQRFGIAGGNLSRGIGLLKQQFKEKNRTKKGLYISAVRSWLFNHLLSNRLDNGRWQEVVPGDVVMLAGTNSHFVVDDLALIQKRLLEGDLHLTGPMWGRGRSVTTDDALVWEHGLLQPYSEITQGLESMGLQQERRSIRIIPGNLQAQCNAPGTWTVSFDLPPGSFATSVLRELCDYNNASGQT